METKRIFSKKAEKYARYRCDYSPEAVSFLFEKARLTSSSAVADIGAGTGILTRHFAGKVGQVYAVEPNDEMRALLERDLAGVPGLSILSTCAEDTGLPDQSVDVITVGTAIHWFDPQPTRQEFLRILKPGGWLAVLRNPSKNQRMNAAVQSMLSEENGATVHAAGPAPWHPPVEFYYGKTDTAKYTFPFLIEEDWEAFLGAMVSQSNAPNEDHPLYPRFEAAARDVFNQFCRDEMIQVEAETEMYLEQPLRDPAIQA
jgi:ubiquinone/menaquinone biosynthesis C-methylase UbiE